MYDKLFALGVTIYGQMTAGSYCYIGPQGIVHGTTVSVHTVATIVNRIMVVELQHMEAIIIIILWLSLSRIHNKRDCQQNNNFFMLNTCYFSLCYKTN